MQIHEIIQMEQGGIKGYKPEPLAEAQTCSVDPRLVSLRPTNVAKTLQLPLSFLQSFR